MKDLPVYLDYNATTPVDPRVAEAMDQVLREDFGNPSSGHILGRRAQDALDAARAEAALLLGAQPAEIVFTSGGTEADNLALKGVAFARGSGHIVTCLGEHPAVTETCAFLERLGFRVTLLPIDDAGRVNPHDVERAITADTFLISAMHANNETGTIQPIRDIGRIARERGILFHTDAAQSVGKIPVQVDELGVDLLAVAGHKLYAPKGVGALYVRRGLRLEPALHGGGQEGGLRSGTEAVHQAVGLAAACRIAREEAPGAAPRIRALRDRLHDLLREGVRGLALNGHPDERLPNTLNVSFPGAAGSDLLAEARSVAASTGSACHSGEARLSPVLAAMGVDPGLGRGAVRLSLGRTTTIEEVEAAACDLIAAHRKLAGKR